MPLRKNAVYRNVFGPTLRVCYVVLQPLARHVVQILRNPLSLLVSWSAFLFLPFIDVLRYSVISAQFVDRWQLRLVLAVLKGTQMLLFAVSATVILTWLVYFAVQKVSLKQRSTIIFVALSSMAAVFLGTSLLILEQHLYPNFIYSTIGLTQQRTVIFRNIYAAVALWSVSLIIVSNKARLRLIQRVIPAQLLIVPGSRYAKLHAIVNMAVCSMFVLICFSIACTLLLLPKQYRAARVSYEQRLGGEFRYIDALAQVVPNDGTIIHPPQNATWQLIGNQPMIRYFLHPRQLISGALLTDVTILHQVQSAYFPVITHLGPKADWPKIDTKNQTIEFSPGYAIPYQELHIVATYNMVDVMKAEFR